MRDKIVLLIIPLILLIPSILTGVSPDRNAARIELRKVQEFPAIPTSLRELYLWPKAFDRYIFDHFFMRNLLIRKISTFLYTFDISISKEVLIGKEGWLFLSTNNDVVGKHRGIHNLSPKQANKWVQVMASRARSLRQSGIECWFVIIPNKHSIYPHYLPDWCTRVAPSLTDTLVQRLGMQDDIHWIDLRPVMAEASKKFPVYVKYNTHWNDRGAYIAYTHIMQQLSGSLHIWHIPEGGIRFPDKSLSGDLARLINLQNYLTEESPVAKISHSSITKKTVPKNFQTESWWTTTSHPSARAAILCDSFVYSYMQKYLQESFSYTFFHHHNGMRFNKDLILQQHPDVVIYMVAERLIPSRLPS